MVTPKRDLERQQEHAVEQQHQPRRIAEEMGHEPGAAAHRRQQRDLARARGSVPNTVPIAMASEADRDVEQRSRARAAASISRASRGSTACPAPACACGHSRNRSGQRRATQPVRDVAAAAGAPAMRSAAASAQARERQQRPAEIGAAWCDALMAESRHAHRALPPVHREDEDADQPEVAEAARSSSPAR